MYTTNSPRRLMTSVGAIFLLPLISAPVRGQTPHEEVSRLLELKASLVKKLVDGVKHPVGRFERERAIDELARLGDDAAAPVLIEHLAHEAELSRSSGLLHKFPAGRALVAIGPRAFPAIRARLLQEIPDRELYIVVWVLHGIDGPGVATSRIRRVLEDTKLTHMQRASFEKVLGLLESTNFNDLSQTPQ